MEVNALTVNERIFDLRKNTLKMSQTDFAESVGVSRGVIVNLESGATTPKPQFLDLIARVYNVNRDWLETGEGEMLAEMSRAEKIGRFVADVLEDKPESFRHWLVGVLIDLDDDGWQLLEDAAKLFAGYSEQKKKEDE
jgi:transcriptional regulator with XRE-family HTH domain